MGILTGTGEDDERSVKGLVGRFTTERPELIVLEATGGYELLVVAALAAAALPVGRRQPAPLVWPPGQPRRRGRSLGFHLHLLHTPTGHRHADW